jgi:hypothetical protein
MDDPSAALSALDTSLASLEAAVAPLLARSRASTLDAVGKVDKAKMDVLLAFAINNLVWGELRANLVVWDARSGRGHGKELAVVGCCLRCGLGFAAVVSGHSALTLASRPGDAWTAVRVDVKPKQELILSLTRTRFDWSTVSLDTVT